MKELARGRASAVYDIGGGRVLRLGGAPAREAALMAHARAHGYPVPRVVEVRDDGLVLERVEGGTMLEALGRRPWTAARQMRLLARLHERLHAIEAPDGKGALLHLDLHPANVILSPGGPVVIDWTNARGGDPALDTALAYLILATSGGRAGRVCAAVFSRYADTKTGLAAAAMFRIADANVTESERAAIGRLVGS